MITKADVADLQPGDVVEITEIHNGGVYTYRGPVVASENYKGAVNFADYWLRNKDGEPGAWIDTLTVVSRAPRPLYVNHQRNEPVPGDVVRDADSEHALALFIFAPTEEGEPWWLDTIADWISPAEMREKRLRLLVDGSTGEVVP